MSRLTWDGDVLAGTVWGAAAPDPGPVLKPGGDRKSVV